MVRRSHDGSDGGHGGSSSSSDANRRHSGGSSDSGDRRALLVPRGPSLSSATRAQKQNPEGVGDTSGRRRKPPTET